MTDQQRIELLVDALRRLMRHEPWPPSVQSEKDYQNAGAILDHIRGDLPEDGRAVVFDSKVSAETGVNE